MSHRPLNALVVGASFGCRIQVPALRGAGFDVVGLVGTDAARMSERAHINGLERSFVDLAEAITATGAGVVAISAPPRANAALALTALERGCHILCEKPFALDGAEAASIGTAAVLRLRLISGAC